MTSSVRRCDVETTHGSLLKVHVDILEVFKAPRVPFVNCPLSTATPHSYSIYYQLLNKPWYPSLPLQSSENMANQIENLSINNAGAQTLAPGLGKFSNNQSMCSSCGAIYIQGTSHTCPKYVHLITLFRLSVMLMIIVKSR
jgi:hypothetical protein